jgi:hypothetical protein
MVNVREMSFCRLDNLIAEREKAGAFYTEEEVLYIMDIVARSLEEAKSKKVHHSNLTD